MTKRDIELFLDRLRKNTLHADFCFERVKMGLTKMVDPTSHYVVQTPEMMLEDQLEGQKLLHEKVLSFVVDFVWQIIEELLPAEAEEV